MTKHDHGAEQEDDDSGDLGGEAGGLGIGARGGEIARDHGGADDEESRRQDPGRGCAL